MSDYHPNLDGPAEPIGLAMPADDGKAQSSSAQAPGSWAARHNGYYIEVAPGGPWLTRGYGVTTDYAERGIWQTLHEAQEAMEKSLSPNKDSAAFESGKEAATKVPAKDLCEALEWTAGYMAMLRFRVEQLPNDKLRRGGEHH